MEFIQYNGEELEVHTGDRGGKHIVTSSGKKRYLTENQKASIELKDSGKKSEKKLEKSKIKKKTDQKEPLEKKVEELNINKNSDSDYSSSESDKSSRDDNKTQNITLHQENSIEKSRIQLKELARLYKKQIPDNMGDEYDDDIDNMVNSVAKHVRGKKDWVEKSEATEYISNFLDGEFDELYHDNISSFFKSVQV